MAADQDKTTIATKDGAETPAPAKKKGMSKLILFGGIGVGVLVIGVALALFVLKPMMADTESADASTSTEEKAADKTEKGAAKDKEPKKEAKKESSHGDSKESTVYTIEDIVVNPAGTGGQRFLSVSIGFEVASADVVAALEKKEPLVRDALITILSSKTIAQLTDPKQKEIIRYQVRKRVSELLKTDQLAGVYYTDFVLQ